MWKCKKCGGEVVEYMVLVEGNIVGRVDKDKDNFEEKLINYDCSHSHYACKECDNFTYYVIEDIAKWSDD